ncbi:MAG: ABC transporter substrate-binding protein [Sulfolobaceae archaeon]
MIKRIVTTEPSSTELVAYLDGLRRLVGVSDKCSFPPEVIRLRKVVKTRLETDNLSSKEIDEKVREFIKSNKAIFEVDWNAIEELNPDLIIGQGLCEVCALPIKSFLNSKIKLKIPKKFRVYKVFEYSPKGFLEIAEYAYKLSKLLDVEEKGKELLNRFISEYNSLTGIGHGKRILVIEWLDPIYVAGLWISDLITATGSQTLIRPKEFGKRVSLEEIKKFSPSLLIISPCGFDIRRTLKEIDLIHKIINDVKSIREAYVVDSAYTANPAPRILKFVEFLRGVLTNIYDNNEKNLDKIGVKLL